MSPDAPGFWGLVWGLQDGSNFYFAQFYPGLGLIVYRVVNWSFTSIASNGSAPVPAANEWKNLKLEARNGVYKIFVDGIKQVEFTDTFFPSGKAGVLGYGGNTSVYDNVIIDSWSEPLTVMPEPGYYTCPSL